MVITFSLISVNRWKQEKEADKGSQNQSNEESWLSHKFSDYDQSLEQLQQELTGLAWEIAQSLERDLIE